MIEEEFENEYACSEPSDSEDDLEYLDGFLNPPAYKVSTEFFTV